MADLPRIILSKPDGTTLGDLDPTKVVDVTEVSEVNGEHSLTVITYEELEKGTRLLWRDDMLDWHENVVEGADGEHAGTGDTTHTYWCPWSIQHDLAGTFVTAMPGTGGIPATATAALNAALGGTERWGVGTVTVTSTGSASMWRRSGWEALQILVEVWGGEVRADITVDEHGVASRSVSLLDKVGDQEAKRRFDYGGDVDGIRRTVSDDPWTCRVIPLGAAEETDDGEFGRRITIEDANDGVIWLQNPDAVPLCRVPDGSGGWEYPVQIVENDDIEEPADLKAWALANIEEWTTPKVCYEADVIQLARAGLDAHGVSEGDAVVCVDRKFSPTGLAISGRVLRIERSMLDDAATVLTVGNLKDTLGGSLGDIARSVSTLEEQQAVTATYQASSAYMAHVLQRLNDRANGTGGYTYITEGQGIRTYDRAVSDPLVGTEATQVVEVKGGNIRIANSRTSGGDWDWKTVLASGHIASELVTTAELVAGFIGNRNGTFWDLDNGLLVISSGSTIGGKTVQEVLGADSDEQRVWYRSDSATRPSAPQSWVADPNPVGTNVYNAWTTKVPPLAASTAVGETKYPYLWTCVQHKTVSGTVTSSTVLLDEGTVVMDGGSLVLNSVYGNAIVADSITGREVQARSLSISKLSDLDVGGENLLDVTGSFVAGDWALTRATVPETALLKLTPTTDAASARYKVDYLDYAEHGGQTYTFSADVRVSNDTTSYEDEDVTVSVGVAVQGSADSALDPATDRYKSVTVTDIGQSWKRVYLTLRVPEDLDTGPTSALASGSMLTFQLSSAGRRRPVLVRRPKLERGTVPTAWSPSAGDLATGKDVAAMSDGLSSQIASAEDRIDEAAGVAGDAKASADTAASAAGTVTDAFGSFKAALDNWIRTDSGGLVIGMNANGASLPDTYQRLTATSQEFVVDGQRVMTASGGALAAMLVRADEVHVGPYMWVSRSNGHCSLKYVG